MKPNGVIFFASGSAASLRSAADISPIYIVHNPRNQFVILYKKQPSTVPCTVVESFIYSSMGYDTETLKLLGVFTHYFFPITVVRVFVLILHCQFRLDLFCLFVLYLTYG